jgi:capsular polysaccharide biosynthesis protein
MEDHETELIDYLRVLWRQKWVIAATLITAVVVAWAALRAISPTYQSEASLVLLPSLASELGAETSASALQPEVYDRFAKSTQIVDAIIRMTELPASTPVADLRDRLTVSLDPLLYTADRYASVGDQVLLTFSATAPDPQQAVSIVSVWIAAFESEFREVFLDRTARSLEYFQDNLNQTEAELDGVIEQRIALLSENPLDIMRQEVAVLLNRYSSDVARLHAARNELEILRSRLVALEVELSQRQSSLVLLRTLDPEALVTALASNLSSRDYQILAETQMEEEVLNTTFFALDEMIATKRANVAALESELTYLEGSVASVQSELAVKQPEVLMTEAAVEELDAQVALLRAARTKLAANVQDARIALAETDSCHRQASCPPISDRTQEGHKHRRRRVPRPDARNVVRVSCRLPRASPRTGERSGAIGEGAELR